MFQLKMNKWSYASRYMIVRSMKQSLSRRNIQSALRMRAKPDGLLRMRYEQVDDVAHACSRSRGTTT